MKKQHFWVVGGDGRQIELAKLLAEDGHLVHTFGLRGAESAVGSPMTSEDTKGIWEADCVILPLPVCREPGKIFAPLWEQPVPLDEVLEAMRLGQLVLGGQLSDEVIRNIRARALRWRDYFAREELTIANAVITAEGALQVAMEELPITLHGSRVLILGYGRIGRLLARRLQGLGATVTAAARRQEQLAWVAADGAVPLQIQEVGDGLDRYDVIFNTVPATVLTGQLLRQLKGGCAVIDLASEPGGVDFKAAKDLGIPVVWARGLPGKVAPLTAARAIRQTVYHILEEVPE